MALNGEPLRPVSTEDIETYRTDGEVCLREVLSKDWIDLLAPLARRTDSESSHPGCRRQALKSTLVFGV
jgi:hypothetical protein